MDAKLTLKLDKKAIDIAKIFAKKNRRSISGMVENYFFNLSSSQNFKKKHSPVVESLTSIISEDELSDFIRDDERARYIIKRDT